MRIIHTSDWHLGHVLYGDDRSREQRDMLGQIGGKGAPPDKQKSCAGSEKG